MGSVSGGGRHGDEGGFWQRWQRGAPLFALSLSDEERAGLRADLRGRANRAGVAGLHESEEATRNFVLYASQYLARVSTRLEWEPVLSDLGVDDRDKLRYPEMYDDIERALDRMGRAMIRYHGERRFLASLLREGGLPAFIGDIAGLVVDRATEIGWHTLHDEAARTWVVGRIHQSALGAAKRLLDTAEGRLALADFLADAARARSALVEAGTDLQALSTPDDVRRALQSSGIDLPSVENEKLLLAVLGSFTSEGRPVAARTEPLRLVALLKRDQVQIALRIELDSLDLDAALPATSEYATLTAERCQPSRQRIRREKAGFVDALSNERVIDLPRGGNRGPTSVDVRFAGGNGAVCVSHLGVLEWRQEDELWFGDDGEMLLERREAIQPGESLLVVTWDDRTLRGCGAVEVREVRAPMGAKHAHQVEVRGAGSLVIEGEDLFREIPSQPRRLDVVVFNAQSPDAIAACGFVRALPDVLAANGVEVDIHVRSFGEESWRLVRRGVRGRIALSAERLLRDLVGTVRIRLTSSDEGIWSASWCVLPRSFEVSSRAGRVTVRSSGSAFLRASPGSVDSRHDGIVVTPPHDVDRVDVFLSTQAGERLRLPVNVARGPLRLRPGGTDTATLPLDGTVKLTERQVYAGACLELDGDPGTTLTVATLRGDVILSMTKRSDRRELLPLLELASLVQRMNESPMLFVARANGGDEHRFGVHIPRLTRPGARLVDGAIEFDYNLDDQDLPESPGIALFPVRPATAVQALVKCTFTRASPGKYVARLGAEHAPTSQGRYIAFLVDRVKEPERPMSAGRAMSIPLELRELPCPADLSGLDRALWTRNFDSSVTEINAMVGSPELPAFLDAFAATAVRRMAYGLDCFDLFTIVAHRCPWLLLATLPRLAEPDRDAWLSMWPRQIRHFTWLRLRRRDAALLAKALPRRSSEDRMGLLTSADLAQRMHSPVKHMLEDVLFPGDSLRPIASLRGYELNVGKGRAWARFQLPQSPSGCRWLSGVDLDADLQEDVDRAMEAQVLRAARARAVRALFKTHEIPEHTARLTAPSTKAARDLLSSLEADWRAHATTRLGHQIKGLDREMAIAGMLVAEYANGQRELDDGTLAHVLELERRSFELLDYWLTVAHLLQSEAS